MKWANAVCFDAERPQFLAVHREQCNYLREYRAKSEEVWKQRSVIFGYPVRITAVSRSPMSDHPRMLVDHPLVIGYGKGSWYALP